ncbi:hypothetical protein HHI36_021130 [Cryptolaemus montrouzieri]|uniref:Uncharacterized protein n=1 Tax=Cryptolaemus montrouzieri TaxID=559131 RepID=A0ABD2MVW2_9CUCU
MSSHKIDLYYAPSSPPCRAVLLAAKSADVDLNLIQVKSSETQQELLRINPQNTIPTIVDKDFVLWESRAIMTYLISKYAKDKSLYPLQLEKRAIIDRMLYFDVTNFYQTYLECYYPAYFNNVSFKPYHARRVNDVFTLLDTFLKDSTFVAGNDLTVADLSIVTTVSTYEVSGVNLLRFPNVVKWYDIVRINASGYEEADGNNVLIYRQIIGDIMKKRKGDHREDKTVEEHKTF